MISKSHSSQLFNINIFILSINSSVAQVTVQQDQNSDNYYKIVKKLVSSSTTSTNYKIWVQWIQCRIKENFDWFKTNLKIKKPLWF
jgi:hypothetical protein